MIGYRDTLYIFGGEVGFSNGIETPLWMYNITVRYKSCILIQLFFPNCMLTFPHRISKSNSRISKWLSGKYIIQIS